MELGAPELLIIFVVILLLFGPGRIAGLGKELGSGIREFRQGLTGNEKENNSPISDNEAANQADERAG